MPNCKTIAICNQKGGTGKTITTVNLGIGLARLGKKVLLVNADPQGDLTTCLGWKDNDSLPTTITTKLSEIMREENGNPHFGILHHEENVDLLPANLELSAMELMLVTTMSRETVLRTYLNKVKNDYEYILIDCMPSLGMVTLNALAAADSVIIPVQAQYLPAKGMTQLMQTIGKVKQLERTKKSVKQKLDKLNDQSKKDDVVTFEELGVDRLFIDESHYYKNLFLYTKMRNVGGIAQTEAQKSSDLFMKYRYLDEITGGRGTVFATGTPISNSMVELYTIQRYLQYNTLMKNNLQHFDAWASTFGETVTAVELTPEGTG